MPYINKEDRNYFDGLTDILSDNIENEGHLNYVFTSLIHKYINHNGLNYKMINSMIGVLECSKLELYRKIASPYEDEKIQENGSVSDLDK
jgi:hypothetical protein